MTYNLSTDTDAARGDTHHVTAFFDSQADADKARADLVAAGISPDAISVLGADAGASDAAVDNGGFWHALKEFFVPDEDRYTYAEGLRRGGYALSVRTNEAHYERTIDILDADGAVDIDERSDSWRSEGWSGFPGAGNAVGDNSTAGFGASVAGEDGYAPTASATTSGTAEAESRADSSRVGTGGDVPGLLNPDMRERIGSGTASMMPPTPTGRQDATLRDNAAYADASPRADANAIEGEEAVLGSPTRTGAEMPSSPSTVGSTNERYPDADRGGSEEAGLLNPDMRERIGSGTASMTPPTPTGPQDATVQDNATVLDPSVSRAVEAGDRAWSARRDDKVQSRRVRGYIIDPKDSELDL